LMGMPVCALRWFVGVTTAQTKPGSRSDGRSGRRAPTDCRPRVWSAISWEAPVAVAVMTPRHGSIPAHECGHEPEVRVSGEIDGHDFLHALVGTAGRHVRRGRRGARGARSMPGDPDSRRWCGCPAPLALATNAFPMASVVSARRTVSSVGSRIWVRPQSTAPDSAGRVGDPLRPDTPHGAGCRP